MAIFSHFLLFSGLFTDFFGFSIFFILLVQPHPFKCTVHGVHTFHLGQKVLIHYLDYDGTIKNHDSIITKICWSLNGGQTIMCCGGDSRTLSETLTFSKGDKVRKDVQNHCDAIKRRTVGISQAEYDALENPDEYTLYCIVGD